VGVALFNATTQEVVEASTSAAWLASLVQERSQSAADFIERATAESPLSKTTVELALSQLVDRQVLVALPTGC
jgi:hypothetical protein